MFGVIVGSTVATLLLLTAGCAQAPIRAGEPYNPGGSPATAPTEIAVDLFQDGDVLVGTMYARVDTPSPDGYVQFLVEFPIFPHQDYRLDSLTLELISEAVQPTIMMEPSTGDLMDDIGFSRSNSTVRLHIPDTGRHGDGTILLKFVAERQAFGVHGLRLHAELGLSRGDAEDDLIIKPAS